MAVEYKWYLPVFHGLVNPFYIGPAIFLLTVLWELRLISNRTLYLSMFGVQFIWVVHVDYRMFITGLPGVVEPMTYQIPTGVRILGYALAIGLFTYIGILIAHRVDTEHKFDLARGLPYIKQLWQGLWGA